MLAWMVEELHLDRGNTKVMHRLHCICQVVEHLMHGRPMLAYEDWHASEVNLGLLPADTGLRGDDAAWRVAEIASKVVLAELQRRIRESPYLAWSLDDSDDNAHREQCCIYVYLLHEGRREAHLLQLHELPGADAKADDIVREALHVMCTHPAADDLLGTGYGEGGLNLQQFGEKTVALASDGARVMFGSQNGALVQLQKVAPHAGIMWCCSHRVALAGRDMEDHASVKDLRRLVVSIASDMNGSSLRNQARLQVLRDLLSKDIAILSLHRVRWLSLFSALENILKQYGPLTVYYSRRDDPEGAGIAEKLTDTDMLLRMHGLVGILAPINRLCKRLQESESGLPDVQRAIDDALLKLKLQFIDNAAKATTAMPGSSCGETFADLVSNDRLGVRGNFSLDFAFADEEALADQLQGCNKGVSCADEIATMVVGKGIEQCSVVLFHREEGSGRRAPAVPTSAEAWDERVSQMRAELKDIAQCAQQSIQERFPDDVRGLLSLGKFMSPEFWHLSAENKDSERQEAVAAVDSDDLVEQLLELCNHFDEDLIARTKDGLEFVVPAKVKDKLDLRDLDGNSGNADRLLVSQLEDEVADLKGYVGAWPVVGGARPSMMKWQEFWAELTEQSAFQEECPTVCTLARILIVMPHGSVENERGFSNMNFILNKQRNRLSQQHVNDAMRIRSQRNKILSYFSPAWLSIARNCL